MKKMIIITFGILLITSSGFAKGQMDTFVDDASDVMKPLVEDVEDAVKPFAEDMSDAIKPFMEDVSDAVTSFMEDASESLESSETISWCQTRKLDSLIALGALVDTYMIHDTDPKQLKKEMRRLNRQVFAENILCVGSDMVSDSSVTELRHKENYRKARIEIKSYLKLGKGKIAFGILLIKYGVSGLVNSID